MNKDEKNIIIDQLAKSLQEYKYIYVADSSDLTAIANNDFRKLLHKNDVKMQVVKNTLVHKAIEKSNVEWGELKDTLVGTTALLFASNPKAPAVAMKDFRKKSPKPTLKGAYIESGIFIGDDQLNALAELKTKDELVGEIIGLLQSPVKNVVSALSSSGSTVANLVKALSERNN